MISEQWVRGYVLNFLKTVTDKDTFALPHFDEIPESAEPIQIKTPANHLP